MYDSRVLERECGLTATVVEGVHVDDKAQCEAIDANLDHGLSQGIIESTNTKIRLLTRIVFGFHGLHPYRSSPSRYSLSAAIHYDSRPKLTHGYDRRAT